MTPVAYQRQCAERALERAQIAAESRSFAGAELASSDAWIAADAAAQHAADVRATRPGSLDAQRARDDATAAGEAAGEASRVVERLRVAARAEERRRAGREARCG